MTAYLVNVGYILIGLIGLSLLVIFHELGHFAVAKAEKMPVEVFSVGYGKPIKFLSFKWHGTLYGISPIPFGGYCKIPGLDARELELMTDEDKQKFTMQPYWKRFFVAIGGSAGNMFFAVILFALVFMLGVPTATTTISKTVDGSPAQKAGFKAGDTIVAIDGKKVKDWSDAVLKIRGGKASRITITVDRDGKKVDVTTDVTRQNGNRFIGIVPKAVFVSTNPFTALYQGVMQMLGTVAAVLVSFYQLFTGQIQFRPVSPIGIVDVTSQAARHGLTTFIDFIAFVSILIGVSNLLPIVPLDGGRALLWTVERVRNKDFSTRTVVVLQSIGVVLLLGLVLWAVYLDILKPIPSPF